jgi:hypothetical protein
MRHLRSARVEERERNSLNVDLAEEEVEEAMQAGRILIHPAYMPLPQSRTISKDRHSGKVLDHRRRMMQTM